MVHVCQSYRNNKSVQSSIDNDVFLQRCKTMKTSCFTSADEINRLQSDARIQLSSSGHH